MPGVSFSISSVLEVITSSVGGPWRYLELDRNGLFWRKEAAEKATKKKLDVPTSFAGLLVYDALSLAAARNMLAPARAEDADAAGGSAVPFARVRARASGRMCLGRRAAHSIPKDSKG